MSKKTNTMLFILGATVFNVLTTLIGMVLLILALIGIINATGVESESILSWGIPVAIIGAIVLSFFVYRIVLKQVQKKVDLDKHFDPLFGPRRPPKKPVD